MVEKKQIEDALKQVIDPELGMNIVDLGLIYEIKIDKNNVFVKITLTSPSCPVGPMILSQAEESIKAVEGVQNVKLELTFEPPWNPDMMSEEAKILMEFWGNIMTKLVSTNLAKNYELFGEVKVSSNHEIQEKSWIIKQSWKRMERNRFEKKNWIIKTCSWKFEWFLDNAEKVFEK